MIEIISTFNTKINKTFEMFFVFVFLDIKLVNMSVEL